MREGALWGGGGGGVNRKQQRLTSPPAVGIHQHDPIRYGEILCDVSQHKWKIGQHIDTGAFGDIYLASDDTTRHVASDTRYVVKVEPHSSGPLFVEMNFYLRATKKEMMEEWMQSKRLKSLGVPYLYGFGSHVYNGERYRFLVLPRLGSDMQKLFFKHSRRFHVKTAFTLAYHILDALEYIHECGYVHSDIKGANLLLGDSRHMKAPVYLLDFGLVSRYVYRNGVHKEYSPDKRKAEVGTIEFSSRDAHIGAVSRRSDLESLGYNLIQWLDGRLPWEGHLANAEEVKTLKDRSMVNVKAFLATAFSPSHHKPPGVLFNYLEYVRCLDFESAPDYAYCKKLFSKGIRDAGFLDDNNLTFESHKRLTATSRKRLAECENLIQPKRKRLNSNTNRKPCAVFNHNTQVTRAVTRNLERVGPRLRSHDEFNWALVLATNPEKNQRDYHNNNKKNNKKLFFNSHLLPSITPLVPNPINNRNETKKGKGEPGSGVNVADDDGLLNPTPAMIQVMQRKKKRVSEPQLRRSRNDSLNGGTFDGMTLTPAMKEVISNRRQVASAPPSLTRTRSRAKKQHANFAASYKTSPLKQSPLRIQRKNRRRTPRRWRKTMNGK